MLMVGYSGDYPIQLALLRGGLGGYLLRLFGVPTPEEPRDPSSHGLWPFSRWAKLSN